MRHRTVASFWKLYDHLAANEQRAADAAFKQLRSDPRHPSLHFKKVGSDRWSARFSLDHRAVALKIGDDYVWYWIGHHDEYARILKG